MLEPSSRQSIHLVIIETAGNLILIYLFTAYIFPPCFVRLQPVG